MLLQLYFFIKVYVLGHTWLKWLAHTHTRSQTKEHPLRQVQWSLTAGVLVVRQDGSNKVNHCVACDKAVSELLPHLQGKDHYNNLAWYILNHPSPSKLLLDALSGVVKAAKLNNELELVDKTLFSYRCLVCHNKASFSGIKTLEAHLNGRDHKKASLLLSQTLPQQHDVPHPISTPPSVSHHLPQVSTISVLLNSYI